MKLAKKKKYASFEPISTRGMTKKQRLSLIESGWRVFKIGKDEFIVEGKKYPPPTISGRKEKPSRGIPAKSLPAPTWAYETKGKHKGEKIPLMAWPYHSLTIQDFEDWDGGGLTIPESLSKVPNVFGYVWTDSGLHIYQYGKQELLDGHDPTYERISKENRGWYGDRLRSKDYLEARTLVTTDESAAIAWAKAGGNVRIVRDISRSYGVSKKRRGF